MTVEGDLVDAHSEGHGLCLALRQEVWGLGLSVW